MEYGVIMAGGSGTRLWPLSRGDTPKQLLKIVHGKSLLQVSYERLRRLFPPDRIVICTAEAHRQAVREHLPELPAENLLGEPIGRDTVNAIGLSAIVLHERDKEAVMAVVTADHVIEPIENFCRAIRLAFDVVRERPEALVTFGITPTHGHTGLGYIHRGEPLTLQNGESGGYRVQAFKEKPDKPTADRYAESGRYYWNSGMFVWRADTVLAELKMHLPAAYDGLMKIAGVWNTPRRQEMLGEVYPKLPKISVDYAIMEPASQKRDAAYVYTVEMPVEWLDVGSWPALAETLDNDDQDNAVECRACLLIDSDNNIVVSTEPDHLMTTIGISDMIVVHTPQITLVCPKTEAQRIKDVVAKAKDRYGVKFS